MGHKCKVCEQKVHGALCANMIEVNNLPKHVCFKCMAPPPGHEAHTAQNWTEENEKDSGRAKPKAGTTGGTALDLVDDDSSSDSSSDDESSDEEKKKEDTSAILKEKAGKAAASLEKKLQDNAARRQKRLEKKKPKIIGAKDRAGQKTTGLDDDDLFDEDEFAKESGATGGTCEQLLLSKDNDKRVLFAVAIGIEADDDSIAESKGKQATSLAWQRAFSSPVPLPD